MSSRALFVVGGASLGFENFDRAQVDTLRKYVEALGGRLCVEVELGDERIQIA
ncbi:hypothetical protein ACIQC5_15140 [Paenarthrobacter sp. NPDC092416]|uniref:hypothetical protein n=1 Tax=Paenarthrobacter sp. NPDC092416 TaxID=3364386 RepID=UPI0037F8AD4F